MKRNGRVPLLRKIITGSLDLFWSLSYIKIRKLAPKGSGTGSEFKITVEEN